MRPARLLAALLALWLAACTQAPDQPAPSPALWEISGPHGAHGYLFGTAHSLPDGMRWRTRALDKAFASSDVLAVEIADLAKASYMRAVFTRLATTPGEPPLEDRVSPGKRALVRQVMADHRLEDADYADMETWAAALSLSQLDDDGGSANGVDRALLAAARGKRVVELEGVDKQLGLFDALPDSEQADLLEAVVTELTTDDGKDEKSRLHAWLTGDTAALEEETRSGLLADPELREALLVDRNRDWTSQLDAMLRKGRTVFVAVGAAHMVGPDGLASRLARLGYTVKRIQ